MKQLLVFGAIGVAAYFVYDYIRDKKKGNDNGAKATAAPEKERAVPQNEKPQERTTEETLTAEAEQAVAQTDG